MDDFEYLRFLGWAQGGLRLGQGGRGSQKSNFCSRDETKLMSGVSYYRRCTCTCNYCGCWPVLGPPWSHTWPALALPWLHPGPALGAGPTWARPGSALAHPGPPWSCLAPLWAQPGPPWGLARPGPALSQGKNAGTGWATRQAAP